MDLGKHQVDSLYFIDEKTGGQRKETTVFCHVQCTPMFLPKLPGKNLFFYFFKFNYLFIYLYLDKCFWYYQGILSFVFNILWHKKFDITNNYKTQEQTQVQEILCASICNLCNLYRHVLPMYNVHTYFSFKNLSKKWTLYKAKYGQ